jgi:hypothetical protein
MSAHTVRTFQFADLEGTWDRIDSENAMIDIADANAALSAVDYRFGENPGTWLPESLGPGTRRLLSTRDSRRSWAAGSNATLMRVRYRYWGRHAGRLRVASSSAARSRMRSSSVIVCQRVARR